MSNILLSIIVPFHNSQQKCSRLLATLSRLTDDDVELVLVDDGSTDETPALLASFKQAAPCATKLISQPNGGPGSARNTGLRAAQGIYVWFVDSDDDIEPAAINLLREVREKNYDFIDFDIVSRKGKRSTLSFPPGSYLVDEEIRLRLAQNFGRIWSKVIRRDLILEHGMLYPERCLYEDNPLAFIYPFHVRSFLKTELAGYFHHEEHESITRNSSVNPRLFDRLITARQGLETGLRLATRPSETEALRQKFIRLFLLNTLTRIRNRTTLPARIILSARIVRLFRSEAPPLGVDTRLKTLVALLTKHKASLLMAWALSFLLPEQRAYFDALHKRAWPQ